MQLVLCIVMLSIGSARNHGYKHYQQGQNPGAKTDVQSQSGVLFDEGEIQGKNSHRKKQNGEYQCSTARVLAILEYADDV